VAARHFPRPGDRGGRQTGGLRKDAEMNQDKTEKAYAEARNRQLDAVAGGDHRSARAARLQAENIRREIQKGGK
jgi:hypothetical protein